jgi:hypothetical protein
MRIIRRVDHVAEGAVMDVVRWLRSLGLGQYENMFRDNAVIKRREENYEELHVDGGISRCRIAGNQ